MFLQVPGNFHISTHGSREQPQKPDMTHTIKELRIGDRYLVRYYTNVMFDYKQSSFLII